MTVDDDYLWNRTGPRDAEIVELERVLSGLGQSVPPPPFDLTQVHGRSGRLSGALLAVANLSVAAGLAFFVWTFRPATGPVLSVTSAEGTATVGARAVTSPHEWRAGRWLETDSRAHARVEIADVGVVEVDPSTRVELRTASPGDYRLHLARGTVHATIWAPPGQFFVDTSSSTAVDLGCAYSLEVGDDGIGLVRVSLGWVGFEWRGRESFIPAGAVCVTRPGLGPGTPHAEDASPAFREALEIIDVQGASSPKTRGAVDVVIGESSARDLVTLWHLLARVDGADRLRVFDRLSELVPPPATVTRAGILAGNRAMLDDWWDALNLGSATWWRTWKQRWREPGQ